MDGDVDLSEEARADAIAHIASATQQWMQTTAGQALLNEAMETRQKALESLAKASPTDVEANYKWRIEWRAADMVIASFEAILAEGDAAMTLLQQMNED